MKNPRSRRPYQVFAPLGAALLLAALWGGPLLALYGTILLALALTDWLHTR